MKWAEESHALAKSVAYNVAEGGELSEPYIVAGQNTSAKRAALAGYRLADLLNKTLGS